MADQTAGGNKMRQAGREWDALDARLREVERSLGELAPQVTAAVADLQARLAEALARGEDTLSLLAALTLRVEALEQPGPAPDPDPEPPPPDPARYHPLIPATRTRTIEPSQIASALAAAQPGDVIEVLPGDLNSALSTTASGTADRRITIYAQQRHGTRINAAGAWMAWQHRGAYVDIIGFDVSGATNQGILFWDHRNRAAANLIHDIRPNGCDSNGGSGLNSAGQDATDGYNEFLDNTVRRILLAGRTTPDPLCPRVHGIYVANPGCIVRGNVIEDVNYGAIHGDHRWADVLVEDNRVLRADMGILFVGNSNRPGGVWRRNHIEACRFAAYLMGSATSFGTLTLTENVFRDCQHIKPFDGQPVGSYTT